MGMMTRRNVKARLHRYDNEPITPVETKKEDKVIVDYSAMPYFSLVALARKHGIEVVKGTKKEELLKELKALGV